MEKENLIFQLEGVSKSFGKNLVLSNFNLKIERGKIFGIIGPSGVGKTTLLNLLVGLLKPDSGVIYFIGRRLEKSQALLKKLVAMSPQHYSFYPNLTVEENLKFFGKMYGLDNKTLEEKMLWLLSQLQLAGYEKNLASTLSVGMQRRLDIACTLLADTEVYIFDEPFEGLDPLMREVVIKLIKELHRTSSNIKNPAFLKNLDTKKKRRTVIISSHFLKDLEKICDTCILIFNKKIIAQGTISSLKKKYKKESLEEIFKLLVRKEK